VPVDGIVSLAMLQGIALEPEYFDVDMPQGIMAAVTLLGLTYNTSVESSAPDAVDWVESQVLATLSLLDIFLGYSPGQGGIQTSNVVETSTSNTNNVALEAALAKLVGLAAYLNASSGHDASHGGLCAAGYVCTGGSISPTPGLIGALQTTNLPGGYECPKGHYCKIGSSRPAPCPHGSYGPASGRDTCSPCPPGRICTVGDFTAEQLCPLGSFCPGGSSFNGTRCLRGTIGHIPGLETARQCAECPAGMYCGGDG